MVFLDPEMKTVQIRMKLHKLNQDDVMSEFEIMKPYFEEDNIESCSQTSATLSEDIWKKFELLPTPPRSPYHKNEYGQYDELDFPTLQSLDNLFEDDDFCIQENCKTTSDKVVKECSGDQNNTANLLIKDCMWNGVGHRPTSEINKGKWKTGLQQINHPTGCVDPKSVFLTAANEVAEAKSNDEAHKKVETNEKATNEKTETSDSDEEIDVVTVEKPVHKTTLLPRTFVGTLVSKQNKLSFVTAKNKPDTTTNNRSATIVLPTKMQSSLPFNYRGRARNKSSANTPNISATTVTMLIDGSNDLTKAVKVHLKPARASTVSTAIKPNKKVATPGDKIEIKSENKRSIMRLATPGCVANGRTNTSTSPSSRTGKKRIVSLDGVSFSSTLGHRQYQNNYNRAKNYKKSAGVPELVSIKQECSSPVVTPVKLTTNSNRVSIASANVPITISDAESLMEASFNSSSTKRQRICASAPTSPLSQKRKRKLDSIGTSSSSSGSDNEQIRAAHNVLERQRREGLRTSFHLLRNEVPELQTVERTPKVNILSKARDYCVELAEKQERLLAEKMAVQVRNELLQKRLQELKEEMPDAMVYFEEDLSEMDASEDELLTPVSSVPSSPSSISSSENEMCKIPSSSYLDCNKSNYAYFTQVSRTRTTSNSSDIQSLLNILKSSENTSWQNSPPQKHIEDDYNIYGSGRVKMLKENIEINSINIPQSLLQC